MLPDIHPDLRLAAGIAMLPQPLKADGGIRDILTQQVVQKAGITGKDRHFSFQTCTPMRLDNEAVLLITAQPAPGDPGTAFELRKVYFFRIELVTKFHLHLIDGLC